MCICVYRCDDIDAAIYMDKSIDTNKYNIEDIDVYKTTYKHEHISLCECVCIIAYKGGRGVVLLLNSCSVNFSNKF